MDVSTWGLTAEGHVKDGKLCGILGILTTRPVLPTIAVEVILSSCGGCVQNELWVL